jgi:large subunit ribosomal protein L28
MSRICQITGKTGMVGNNVSHSNRRTKRKFHANLFTKRFYYQEEDRWVTIKVSASGIRLINKLGLHNAMKQAVEKGLLSKTV